MSLGVLLLEVFIMEVFLLKLFLRELLINIFPKYTIFIILKLFSKFCKTSDIFSKKIFRLKTFFKIIVKWTQNFILIEIRYI